MQARLLEEAHHPIKRNTFVRWPRNDSMTLSPVAIQNPSSADQLCACEAKLSESVVQIGPVVLLEQSATTYNTSDALILLCKNETQRNKHCHHRIGYF